MYSPIRTIRRKILRTEGEKLNILCSATHERYESMLAMTGHNFYAYTAIVPGTNNAAEGMKPWNEKFAPVPDNYKLIGNQIPLHIDFDIVLSQNKFGQFQALQPIAKSGQIPLVSLEHTLPIPTWPKTIIENCRTMSGDIDVFISNFSLSAWGMTGEVIEHGLDTDLFKPDNQKRESVCLSVVNDWINRDFCCNFTGWQRITHGLPVFVLGDTPGLSLPAKSTEELIQTYQKSLIFVNTSTISPVPTALLEAMSCGCAVVTLGTCMIPEIIKDGENGYISNDETILRSRIIELLQNPNLAAKLGNNARKTIVDKFNINRFVNDWNKILYKAANITNNGEKYV